MGLKSGCQGVSTTGRDQEKEQTELEQTQQAGQQQEPEKTGDGDKDSRHFWGALVAK